MKKKLIIGGVVCILCLGGVVASATMKEFNPEINEDEYYEQVEQKEIERRSLYIGAVEAGISVTDEEVQNVIDELKNNLSEDKEAYEQLMAYLAGRKIAEEEYWQEIKPIYIRNLTIQKYLESMEEKALKDSQEGKNTEEEIREKADEQLIEDCIDKYEVSVE